MKFNVTRTSDWGYEEQIEINSLEELISFIKEQGSCIVTVPMVPIGIEGTDSFKKSLIPSIEIYDDWRE